MVRQDSRKGGYFYNLVGVYIAKTTYYAFIINIHGVLFFHPFVFKNTINGYQLYLSQFSVFNKNKVLISFELIDHYHVNIFKYLSDYDYKSFLTYSLST